MYSIWLQNSIHNDKAYNLIQRYAKEEKKDSFFPHVTLVAKLNSHERATEVMQMLSNKKCNITFDKISTGDTYFQKLYLESSNIKKTTNNNFMMCQLSNKKPMIKAKKLLIRIFRTCKFVVHFLIKESELESFQ